MTSIPNRRLPGRVTPHPGEFLRELLDELGISQTKFHERTGMSMQRISEIFNGKRGITPETAWILGRAFDQFAEVLDESAGHARSDKDQASQTDGADAGSAKSRRLRASAMSRTVQQ